MEIVRVVLLEGTQSGNCLCLDFSSSAAFPEVARVNLIKHTFECVKSLEYTPDKFKLLSRECR